MPVYVQPLFTDPAAHTPEERTRAVAAILAPESHWLTSTPRPIPNQLTRNTVVLPHPHCWHSDFLRAGVEFGSRRQCDPVGSE